MQEAKLDIIKYTCTIATMCLLLVLYINKHDIDRLECEQRNGTFVKDLRVARLVVNSCKTEANVKGCIKDFRRLDKNPRPKSFWPYINWRLFGKARSRV